jgi:hypothetical protein
MEAKLRSRGLGQVIDAIPEEPYLVPFTTQEEFVLEARLPDCDTFFFFFFSKFARRSLPRFLIKPPGLCGFARLCLIRARDVTSARRMVEESVRDNWHGPQALLGILEAHKVCTLWS